MCSMKYKLNPTATKPCALSVFGVQWLHTTNEHTDKYLHDPPLNVFDFDMMDDEHWTKNNNKNST